MSIRGFFMPVSGSAVKKSMSSPCQVRIGSMSTPWFLAGCLPVTGGQMLASSPFCRFVSFSLSYIIAKNIYYIYCINHFF